MGFAAESFVVSAISSAILLLLLLLVLLLLFSVCLIGLKLVIYIYSK